MDGRKGKIYSHEHTFKSYSQIWFYVEVFHKFAKGWMVVNSSLYISLDHFI
jgi:hypothetical protein